MKGRGILFSNDIRLQEHEQSTIQTLLDNGYNIELIKPSTVQGSKSPDIMIDGISWEMKSPVGKSKWTIKNIMQKASHQCDNIIIDLRRLDHFPQEKYIEEVKKHFQMTKRFKRLKIIIKGNILLEFVK